MTTRVWADWKKERDWAWNQAAKAAQVAWDETMDEDASQEAWDAAWDAAWKEILSRPLGMRRRK